MAEQLTSRTFIIEAGPMPTYLTSETWESGKYWLQPPASHYNFEAIGNNFLVQLAPQIYLPAIKGVLPFEILEPQLQAEFDAWEAASDETLSDF